MTAFFESKKTRFAALALVGALLLLGAFRLGELVGYRKALFSYRFGENYSRLFGAPHPGFFRTFDFRDGFVSAHGVAGTILRAGGGELLLEGGNGIEKSVMVGTTTVIRQNAGAIPASRIAAGEGAIIIGDPTADGRIAARFIRIFGAPPPRDGSSGKAPGQPGSPR